MLVDGLTNVNKWDLFVKYCWESTKKKNNMHEKRLSLWQFSFGKTWSSSVKIMCESQNKLKCKDKPCRIKDRHCICRVVCHAAITGFKSTQTRCSWWLFVHSCSVSRSMLNKHSYTIAGCWKRRDLKHRKRQEAVGALPESSWHARKRTEFTEDSFIVKRRSVQTHTWEFALLTGITWVARMTRVKRLIGTLTLIHLLGKS